MHTIVWNYDKYYYFWFVFNRSILPEITTPHIFQRKPNRIADVQFFTGQTAILLLNQQGQST